MIANRNVYFKRYYEKYDCDVRIVEDNIEDEDYAYELEAELICMYKSIGECFTNITDGWENPPVCRGERNGMYGKNHTEESRRKMSEALKNSGSSNGKNNSQYGISPKDRMSREVYDGWIEKHRQKMSGSGNSQYKISPYQRILAEKIELWKKHISESCKDELNGNARSVRMYNEDFLIDFPMIKRCVQYIYESDLTSNARATINNKVSNAISSGKSYLGFYFDYIKR